MRVTAALRFGYVTNGLGDHRLADALALLADAGYDGVALTLDHHHLDPLGPGLRTRVAAAGRLLRRTGLTTVIETGSRFVLDPRRKHEPTLVSPSGAGRRVDLLARAIDIAAELGAPVVSLWSGAPAAGDPMARAHRRLAANLEPVLRHAERSGVLLGFEPEPGMLVETLDQALALRGALGEPGTLGITLDIGHCRCVEAGPAPEVACVRRAGDHLVHVHIEDMRRGVHEHLELGAGEVDVAGALEALAEIGYGGLVAVELSRHSHVAHEMVPRALAHLRAAAPRPAGVASGPY